MHLKAIEIKERLLGPDDYEVALSIGHLASLYNYDMEKYDEAEKLYLRSIAIGKCYKKGWNIVESGIKHHNPNPTRRDRSIMKRKFRWSSVVSSGIVWIKTEVCSLELCPLICQNKHLFNSGSKGICVL